MSHSPGCSCPMCMTERLRLMDQKVKIDKPHEPWGKHVDVITPLSSGIPGVEKLRIGPTGDILTQEIKIKKSWP